MEWQSHYYITRGRSVLLMNSQCFALLGEQRRFFRGEDGPHKTRASIYHLGISTPQGASRVRTFCPYLTTCCGVNLLPLRTLTWNFVLGFRRLLFCFCFELPTFVFLLLFWVPDVCTFCFLFWASDVCFLCSCFGVPTFAFLFLFWGSDVRFSASVLGFRRLHFFLLFVLGFQRLLFRFCFGLPTPAFLLWCFELQTTTFLLLFWASNIHTFLLLFWASDVCFFALVFRRLHSFAFCFGLPTSAFSLLS